MKESPSVPVGQGDFRTRLFKPARELDYLINLPVAKAHCQTRITCALKNLKGLLPDSEKRRFHSQGLHRPIAELSRLVRQDLIIADGIQGDLTFEEGGNPVRMDRIMIARDPVLLDSFVAESLGYHWTDIEHLSLAARLGVGRPLENREQIVELNRPQGSAEPITGTRALKRLLDHIDERQACSTCLGGLIHALQRLENQGRLAGFKKKICIGQGFKEISGSNIGIGNCTAGFSRFLPGCPPSPADIVPFLRPK